MSSPSIPFHLAKKIIINRPLSPRLIKIPLKFLLRPLLMQLPHASGRMIFQCHPSHTTERCTLYPLRVQQSEPLNTFALNISANF